MIIVQPIWGELKATLVTTNFGVDPQEDGSKMHEERDQHEPKGVAELEILYSSAAI
jgi:hypothetical protein